MYLRTLSELDETREAAQRLYPVLVEAGVGGITKSALHKDPPAGLGRTAAKRAIAVTPMACELVETKRSLDFRASTTAA